MTKLGADVDQLDALALKLEAASQSLDGAMTGIETTIRSLWWQGPVADQFRVGWTRRDREVMTRSAEVLAQAAGDVRRNVEQQRRASDGDNLGPGGISAPVVDLRDPGPTGKEKRQYWFFHRFDPDDYRVVSMASVDASPRFSADVNDPRTLTVENVEQGQVGDCYFAAAVASMVSTPEGRELLADMIRANGDGTYTVRFADGQEVRVDSDVYVNEHGQPAFGRGNTEGYNWFSVLEKAYAERSEGRSYAAIDGGTAAKAWNALIPGATLPSFSQWPSSEQLSRYLTDDLAAGHPIAVSLDVHNLAGDGYPTDSWHELTVLDADIVAGTVTIRNPWGENQYRAKDEKVLRDLDWASLGGTIGPDGLVTVPIDRLAPLIRDYESCGFPK